MNVDVTSDPPDTERRRPVRRPCNGHTMLAAAERNDIGYIPVDMPSPCGAVHDIGRRQTHTLSQMEPLHNANGVDCSLWTLACVAAVLRSWRTTGLAPEDLPCFRQFLYCHLCSLV